MNATNDMLNEKGGVGLTIEAIAKRAGVGKPTIYRWWPSMADIVLDQFRRRGLWPTLEAPRFSQHGGHFPTTGTQFEDLVWALPDPIFKYLRPSPMFGLDLTTVQAQPFCLFAIEVCDPRHVLSHSMLDRPSPSH